MGGICTGSLLLAERAGCITSTEVSRTCTVGTDVIVGLGGATYATAVVEFEHFVSSDDEENSE